MRIILLLIVIFGTACSKIEKRELNKNTDKNIETVKYITEATLSRMGCNDLSEKILHYTSVLNDNIVYHINEARTININKCVLQLDMDLNLSGNKKEVDEIYCYISIKF